VLKWININYRNDVNCYDVKIKNRTRTKIVGREGPGFVFYSPPQNYFNCCSREIRRRFAELIFDKKTISYQKPMEEEEEEEDDNVFKLLAQKE
jgi:hypothetical protein